MTITGCLGELIKDVQTTMISDLSVPSWRDWYIKAELITVSANG